MLTGELRWRTTRFGATAYVVERGGAGGLTSIKVLRDKSGKIVCCPDWLAGVGDLIEKIETLTKEGKLE